MTNTAPSLVVAKKKLRIRSQHQKETKQINPEGGSEPHVPLLLSLILQTPAAAAKAAECQNACER
jgi:hypothetical protein